MQQTGTASYNTGITQGPSLTSQQYGQYLHPFSQIGQNPMARPVAPAYGNYGHPMLSPGGGLNQARSLLGTQAGNTAANAFSNQVNQDQANLASQQAGANASLGNAMQGAMGDIYSGALNRGSALNSALASNAVRTQGLYNDLAGNLFGIQTGLVGNAINPLLSGLFHGISGLAGGLMNAGTGGGLGNLLSGMQSSLGGDPLAGLTGG